METTYIDLNGVKVEGIILYRSPVSNSFIYQVYDEIIYAQHCLVKLHHRTKFDNNDNPVELEPEIEIINKHVVIPELD